MRTVDFQYSNAQIPFSEEDEDKGLASMDCYISQSSSEERKKWREVEKKDKSNTLNFREFAVSKKKRKNL